METELEQDVGRDREPLGSTTDLWWHLCRLAARHKSLPRESHLRLTQIVQRGSRKVEDSDDPLKYERTAEAVLAQSVLWHHDLHYILTEARRYALPPFELLDAVQVASLGYLRAVDKFDPAFGVALITYARHWVRQALCKARRGDRANRLSNLVCAALAKAERLAAVKAVGVDEALRELCGGSEEKLKLLRGAYGFWRGFVYLQTPLFAENRETLADSLGDPRSTDLAPDGRSLAREELGKLVVLIYALTPRQREVVTRSILGASFAELGRRLGLTRERVRQIEVEARDKLRALLESRDLQTLLLAAPCLSAEDFLTLIRPPRPEENAEEKERRDLVLALAGAVRRRCGLPERERQWSKEEPEPVPTGGQCS
ncbi:sigma-70 family RNA polymerase sigma factor [Patescibacteria group bacterium]|nr:MAG: sigma-70 family RNA polymerase sigma factor [Patescibacteria group bacterium]